MNMQWDHFESIKKKFIYDIVNELKSLDLPQEWGPNEVISFVVNKIENFGKKI